MPVVVRDSGKMWNKLGELEDTKCLIPDRCYATMYQECINYVKVNTINDGISDRKVQFEDLILTHFVFFRVDSWAI